MKSIFCCCCKGKKDASERLSSAWHLFVITPRVDEDQGDADTGKDQANMRLIRKALDEKFKEIDNFLGKKVMKNLLDLGQETGARLDVIERGAYDTRDAIKRDTMQKFGILKEQMEEKH
mmetsp:Transcript_17994/g.24133  ORF Transcript_17994/g.24133 Transcript_17994/m.24133 type:complete len:119 (+) Transcript_17994:2749-3105(+)